MNVTIKIQHLSSIKELEVDIHEDVNSLKGRIENYFGIPRSQQSLMAGGRNISTSLNTLHELGIKEGDLVVVKKIRHLSGKEQSIDMASMMSNPMVKGMLKNPEMLKSIQDIFPDLKDEMTNNKSLNMIINNGGFEEELEKMSGNSEYMNQQLRNADLMMAKLSNIPNSMNMMSMMIKDVEDPFKSVINYPVLNGGCKVNEKIRTSVPGTCKYNLSVEYRKQLAELKEIGFDNIRENLEVLRRVEGDLQKALEILVKKKNQI